MRQLLAVLVLVVGVASVLISAQEAPRLPEYVVSPLVLQPIRPGSATMGYKPKVAAYASWVTQITRSDPTTGIPLRSWSLAQVIEWKPGGRVQALADPDITVLESDVLDIALGARATVVQTALNTRYNCGATFTPAMTLREALHQLLSFLDPDADPTKFIVRVGVIGREPV